MTTARENIVAIQTYAGQYEKAIIGEMLTGMDIAQDIDVIYNLTSPRILPRLKVNGGIRPNNTNITGPKNTQRTWTERTISPKRGMKIWSIVPDDLEKTWLSEMLMPNALDLPMAAWVWTKEAEKISSEINESVFDSKYRGDAIAYNAATAYAVDTYMLFTDNVIYSCVTLTTAGQTPLTHPAKWLDVDAKSICNGPGTVIKDAITASELTNVVATGAITSANAWDKINTMFDALEPAHRNKGGVVHVSQDVFNKFIEAKAAEYPNTWTPDMADLPQYIYKSGKKWQFIARTWMNSSQRIIFETRVGGKGTLTMGINKLDDTNNIKTVPNLHGYDAIAKFILCFQFGDPDSLLVNDQA